MVDLGAETRERLMQETSQKVATNAAAAAGAGVDLGGATAREVLLSTERVGVADIIKSHINTKRKVWTLKTEAQALRTQAKGLKKAAKFTKRLAPLKFLAPVASGAGQAKLASK